MPTFHLESKGAFKVAIGFPSKELCQNMTSCPGRCFLLFRKAFKYWKRNDSMLILGSQKATRLPIFSFLVGHSQTGKFLHQHFVSILLNDLYGIQARGGCACAGPYAMVSFSCSLPITAIVIPVNITCTGVGGSCTCYIYRR